MSAYFTSVEDVIADENFLSWYQHDDMLKAEAWQKWLLQHSDDHPIVEQAVAFLNALPVHERSLPEAHVDAALLKLENTLQAKVVRMHPQRKWWMTAAAAIAILLAGVLFFRPAGRQTILATNYGSIGTYKLPDGSEVILNAHSAVTLGKQWNVGNNREIWLKGEAFFKIQKTSAHDKFVVHASSMDIEVTGTQFNVIDRQDESSVLLTEGSVTIHSRTGKTIHMKPGDFVKIENDQLQKKPMNEEKILAWKQSKLVFDHTTMQEVAAIITRYYNVKVRFADTAIAKKEIGGIMSNDNLDLLIESLEALGEFRITKTDKELIISRPS